MPSNSQVAVVLTQCWHKVPGGTAGSILDLVKSVASRNEVDLIGIGPRGGEPAQEWAPPIPVIRASLPLPFLYDAWHTLRRPSFLRATGPVDVVHVTAPVVPPTRGTPMVATVHDLFPVTHPELLTARGARLLRRGLEIIRDEAKVVMVPTQSVAADCRDFGIEDNRLRVVPWGSTPVAPTLPEIADAGRRLGVTGPYVLFVGTLEPRKNLSRLVAAMDQLKRQELSLVIVGPDGWGDGTTQGANVVMTGHLPASELPPLMAGAASFCFPSLAEGFGLPVLEAMAAGAPVITSAGTACAEVAGDAALLVDPTDIDSIANALVQVLDNPDRAEQLRIAGRARAATFTWSAAADAALAAYAEAQK